MNQGVQNSFHSLILSFFVTKKSVLPGSVNFDMPSFEELGINLEGLLSKYNNNNNPNTVDEDATTRETEYQTAKLKNSAYKKLREKV